MRDKLLIAAGCALGLVGLMIETGQSSPLVAIALAAGWIAVAYIIIKWSNAATPPETKRRPDRRSS